jgi:hypothetical protein
LCKFFSNVKIRQKRGKKVARGKSNGLSLKRKASSPAIKALSPGYKSLIPRPLLLKEKG